MKLYALVLEGGRGREGDGGREGGREGERAGALAMMELLAPADSRA